MSTYTEPIETAEHAHEHDEGAARTYLVTLVALLILTGITVGAASFDFGSGNVVIALAIATVKAMLVALIFMHLRYEKKVNAVIAGAGFLFLGIFLMFCSLDFGSRVNLQPINYHPLLQEPPANAPTAPATAGEKK